MTETTVCKNGSETADSSTSVTYRFETVSSGKMELSGSYDLTPCASFLNRDFAFGDQGASPLEPDRQGAGAEYLRAGKGETPFPPGGGGSTVDRQAGT